MFAFGRDSLAPPAQHLPDIPMQYTIQQFFLDIDNVLCQGEWQRQG